VGWSDLLWPGLLCSVFLLAEDAGGNAVGALDLLCLATWAAALVGAGDALSVAQATLARTDPDRSGRITRRGRKVRRSTSITPLKTQLWFALPLTAAGLVAAGLTWVDHLLLARLSSAETVGLYGPAARCALLLGLGLQGVNAMLGPSFARRLSQGDREEARRLFAVGNRWAFTWALLGLAALAGCGQPLLRLFGEDWAQAHSWMLLLGVGWVVNAGVGSVGLWMKMEGRVAAVVGPGLSCLGLGVVIDVLLIPSLGGLGAAIGTATAMAAQNIWMAQLARRSAGRGWNLPPRPGLVLLGGATVVAMGASMALAHSAPLLALLVSAGLLGGGCLVGWRLFLAADDLPILRTVLGLARA